MRLDSSMMAGGSMMGCDKVEVGGSVSPGCSVEAEVEAAAAGLVGDVEVAAGHPRLFLPPVEPVLATVVEPPILPAVVQSTASPSHFNLDRAASPSHFNLDRHASVAACSRLVMICAMCSAGYG